jgi:hypothetical protein
MLPGQFLVLQEAPSSSDSEVRSRLRQQRFRHQRAACLSGRSLGRGMNVSCDARPITMQARTVRMQAILLAIIEADNLEYEDSGQKKGSP